MSFVKMRPRAASALPFLCLIVLHLLWPDMTASVCLDAYLPEIWRDFKVTPSQGTHFFQNLTSFNIGYFTVNPEAGDGFIDWKWLAKQAATREAATVRHLHLDEPVVVKMNGKTNQGVIFKPGAGGA